MQQSTPNAVVELSRLRRMQCNATDALSLFWEQPAHN